MTRRMTTTSARSVVTRPEDTWQSDKCPVCGETFKDPPEAGLRRARVETQLAQSGRTLVDLATANSLPADVRESLTQMATFLGLVIANLKEEVDHAWGSAARWMHIAEHAQKDEMALRIRLDALQKEKKP